MLNFFRSRVKVIKIVFLFLAFLIALSMVITLIPGMTGISADPNAIAVVAEVGGEEITTYDVQQGVLQLGRNAQIPSELLWLYAQQVLDQIVLEKASVAEARRMGLRVSEDDLRMRLRLIPELFPGGQFVGHEQYEDLVLQRFGTSVAEFERRFRNTLLIEKLRQAVTDSIGVTPAEIREVFERENEKLVLHYVFFDPADYRKEVRATDEALQDYFQKNATRYEIPEQRRARFLLLETAKLRESVTISEAEQRRYYQEHLDDYRLPERVSVKHILLRGSEAEPEKLAEARKKAADLLAKLKAGANFEELAKANSEDTGTAQNGGDLGWIVRGQTVANFEAAAFSLAPGTLSDLVQTEYGIHILKVSEHEPARLRPFEEVQRDIANQLLEEKVQSVLSAAAEQAASDWRAAPQELEAVAARHRGVVLTPPPFSRAEGVEGIPASQALSEDVFLLEKGQIGRPVSVPAGYAIPQLEEIIPPRTPEFAEVKERVRTDYVDAESRALAQAKALELVQALERQETRNLVRQARSMGLRPATTEPILRSGTIPSVGPVSSLGPRLDTIQPGEVAGPVPVSGGQIVFQLESRQPPDEASFEAQREPIRLRLLSQKQAAAFAMFQENLRERMTRSGEVKIHQAVLDRITAGALR